MVNDRNDLKMLFNKELLIKLITENRNKHRDIFERAVETYRKVMIEILEGRLNDIKNNKKIEHFISLPEPKDHTSDYDAVLEMLYLTNDDEIELNADSFRMYVKDEWDWKDQFIGTVSRYTSVK